MLPGKRSVGVDPEVNLTKSLHTGEEAHKTRIYLDFETMGRCHQKSKTGVSAVPQKGLMSSFFFQKVCIVSKINDLCASIKILLCLIKYKFHEGYIFV